MKVKEAIELLEKAKESNDHIFRALKIHAHVNISDAECTDSFIDQTLAIIRPLAEEPEAGEWTKEVRAAIIDNGRGNSGFYDTCKCLEACDEIDHQAQTIKDQAAENAKLNLILYHRENGLSHPDLNNEILQSKLAEAETNLKVKDELLEWAWVNCGSQNDLTGYLAHLEEMNKPSEKEYPQ